MINKNQYSLLKKFENGLLSVKAEYDPETLESLKQSKLVEINNFVPHGNDFLIVDYKITQLGKSAVEEYERVVGSFSLEKESINIAKESNELSKIANKRSKTSNIVSCVAVVVSIVAVIVSILN